MPDTKNFDDEIKKILKELNFTEIQATFYLLILKSKGTTVSKAANELRINRTNAYAIVEKLKSHGLIWEENVKYGKKVYSKSYKEILQILQERQKELTNLQIDIQNFIPVFNQLNENLNEEIQFKTSNFKGFGGLEFVFESIINNAKKEIFLIANKNINEIIPKKILIKFNKNRIKKNLNLKVITNSLTKNESLLETKNINSILGNASFIFIYSKTICLIDELNDVSCTIIENDSLYNIIQNLFNFIWINIGYDKKYVDNPNYDDIESFNTDLIENEPDINNLQNQIVKNKLI